MVNEEPIIGRSSDAFRIWARKPTGSYEQRRLLLVVLEPFELAQLIDMPAHRGVDDVTKYTEDVPAAREFTTCSKSFGFYLDGQKVI